MRNRHPKQDYNLNEIRSLIDQLNILFGLAETAAGIGAKKIVYDTLDIMRKPVASLQALLENPTDPSRKLRAAARSLRAKHGGLVRKGDLDAKLFKELMAAGLLRKAKPEDVKNTPYKTTRGVYVILAEEV